MSETTYTFPAKDITKVTIQDTPPVANSTAILAEMRLQTKYLRNVNRWVNFQWVALITLVVLGVAGGAFWIVAQSVVR